MKRRKKKKERHTESRTQRSEKDGGFHLVRHPLSSVDRDALKAALLATAKDQVRDFPNHLVAISNIVRSKYPPQILATLATYGLTASVSDEGVASKTMIPQLQQHHVELLQALILMVPDGAWGREPAVPQDIQQVIDTITKLADAFNQRRFLAMEEQRDFQEDTVLALQERLRMQTQAVRNWGHFSQVVRISAELYAPLDEVFRKTHGFSATDVINVSRTLVSINERRISKRFEMLRTIFSARTIPTLVRRYYKHYPHVVGNPNEFIKLVPSSATFASVKFQLLAHADFGLVNLAIIEIDNVVKATSLPLNAVTRILESLSLSPGALQQYDPEHLFLGNPVWRAPIIKCEDEFLCPMPQVIFSHIHDIMRNLAKDVHLNSPWF